MDPRAAHLIATLGLRPHPEGGHFRELFRAPSPVQPHDGRPERSALTTIYFLLAAGEVSRWHRVASDEVWHFFEGDPLELFTADPAFDRIDRRLLAPVGDAVRPEHVVRAGTWQAARTTSRYTLAGCVVAPGFEFADFELLRDRDDQARAFASRYPELSQLV